MVLCLGYSIFLSDRHEPALNLTNEVTISIKLDSSGV